MNAGPLCSTAAGQMMTCVLTLSKTNMKKTYKTPEMKEVSLTRCANLLECSNTDGDETPCIEGPIGMGYKDNLHNG